MLRVVIGDYEQCYIDRLKEYLVKICKQRTIELKIYEYTESLSLLEQMEEWIDIVDVMFLEVQLDTKNGIDIACLAREKGYVGEVLFFSHSTKHVFQSFNAKPLNYLIKEKVSFEQFSSVIDSLLLSIGDKTNKIFVYHIKREKFIARVKNIVFFQSKSRIIYMCVQNKDGKFEYVKFYNTIENLEERMENATFIRPNHSCLVNVAFIKKIEAENIELESGDLIKISRFYRKEVERNFEEYFKGY